MKKQAIENYDFVKLFPNKFIFFCFLGIIFTYLFNFNYFIAVGIDFISLLSLKDYIEGSSFFTPFFLGALYYANTFPWNKFITENSLIKVWLDISRFYFMVVLILCITYNIDFKFLLISLLPFAEIACIALIIRHYTWQNDIFVKKLFFIFSLISIYGIIAGVAEIKKDSKVFVQLSDKDFPVVRILSSGVIYKTDQTIKYIRNENILSIYYKHGNKLNLEKSTLDEFLDSIKRKFNKTVDNHLTERDNYPEVPIATE